MEKDHSFNIDAQDNQDGRLLHERLTPAMIACGFQVERLIRFGEPNLEFKRFVPSNTDVQDYKPAVSRMNPVHPVHRCESSFRRLSTLNRFPTTRRRRLFRLTLSAITSSAKSGFSRQRL